MAVEKKSNSITEVDREALGFTLTSANQDLFPVVYSDDVWSIVKQGTKISAIVGEATVEDGCMCSCPNESGTYTLFNIIEALADYILQTALDLSMAISAGGAVETMINETVDKLDSTVSAESRNFTVEVEEEDGRLKSVSIDVPDLDSMYDRLGAAADVLGKSTDTYDTTTVYGAFAAVRKLRNDMTATIASLDSEVQDEDNGISVTVTEVDGKLTRLVVVNTLLGSVTDGPDAKTIYGAKALALQVLGKPTDTAGNKTVYGAFAAAADVERELDEFKASRIPDDKIRELFCTDGSI